VHHVDPAIHLNSKIFSKWVTDEIQNQYGNIFSIISDNVQSIENTSNNKVIVVGKSNSYEFDYVIDCTGFSSNTNIEKNDIIPLNSILINSVILFPQNGIYNPEQIYTTSQAHKNGWMFEIPLTSRKTSGYLYNNKITTYEEALSDFCKIKNIDESTSKSLRNFSWIPFYKKNALEGRILYCGNKLFFFEPNQGFLLHYYAVFVDLLVSSIKNNNVQISNTINDFYLETVKSIEDVILLTYQSNVKYTTNFWKI
jgi:tryptophan halogenase